MYCLMYFDDTMTRFVRKVTNGSVNHEIGIEAYNHCENEPHEKRVIASPVPVIQGISMKFRSERDTCRHQRVTGGGLVED